jgi:hypothetical protein
MIFQVNHYNFGTLYTFATEAEAKAFTFRANFDAVIYRDAERIATYSSISGWRAA